MLWITGRPSLIKWPIRDREVRNRLVEFYINHYLDHVDYLFMLMVMRSLDTE